MNIDEIYMRMALKEAQIAFEQDEVPVGAVIVYKNQILAKAHNQVEVLKDPTAHAEMIAITQAANTLGSKWLYDASLYVTIEPCSMCAGALVLSRIKNIIFAAKDPKTGACGSVFNIVENRELNHRISVKSGILEVECSSLISRYFQKRRNKKIAVKN